MLQNNTYSSFRKPELSSLHALSFISLVALILFIATTNVCSAQITLAWNPNTEPDLAGHKIYSGPSSGNYVRANDLKAESGKISQDANTTDIQKEDSKKSSFSDLSRFFPNNSADLAAWFSAFAACVAALAALVAIFVTVYLHFAKTKHDEPSSSVHVEKNILKVLEQISAYMKTNEQFEENRDSDRFKEIYFIKHLCSKDIQP